MATFIIEEVRQPTHHDSIKRERVIGEATPKRFSEAVYYCFNRSSRTGLGMIIYLGNGRRKIAKLYQAKYNSGGYVFSTFHHPSGEQWRIRARLSSSLERAPGMAYSSQI